MPTDSSSSDPISPLRSDFLHVLSGVFESLGRAIICVDSTFRVVHASRGLDTVADPGAAEWIVGRSLSEVFGPELFAPGVALRRALEAGERREGWGATLQRGQAARPLSLSAAPVPLVDSAMCDPRVRYILVVRPGEAAGPEGATPTVFSGLVASSQAMLDVFRLVQQLAESDATVLITGESGTGKELVARAVHDSSPRRSGPFVAVNCGAIPAELLESELFGHVRGAFTGAHRDREGRFELARGGALFLDEVGDLPLALQVKLLRVLQERTFERVGDSRSRRSDARIIAATNRDLKRETAEGRFREDLYYRLRVVPVEIPPLRARRVDIEPLALHLLARVNARHGRALRLAPDALRALLRYAWPGNVRELQNALEYAVAVCPAQTIHAGDLPAEVQEALGEASGDLPPARHAAAAGREPAGSDAERGRIEHALAASRWNRERAALELGISRTTLWRKMRELGIGR